METPDQVFAKCKEDAKRWAIDEPSSVKAGVEQAYAFGALTAEYRRLFAEFQKVSK